MDGRWVDGVTRSDDYKRIACAGRCYDFVLSWSDDYKRIAYVACVCVCVTVHPSIHPSIHPYLRTTLTTRLYSHRSASDGSMQSIFHSCESSTALSSMWAHNLRTQTDDQGKLHCIRRMRSVCSHHSKTLQHHRIITRLHTQNMQNLARLSTHVCKLIRQVVGAKSRIFVCALLGNHLITPTYAIHAICL